jgi:UDP-2,4-diacetamido-2,4,6-trideoxy-beta-L-altropyranose hydrolase
MNIAVNTPLIIRADATPKIGMGHLMRSLALAQAWKQKGGRVTFITACERAGPRRRISEEGFEVIGLKESYPKCSDWEITSSALSSRLKGWVVLDGYHFDPAYQRLVKEAGQRLLVIDDTAHLEHYYADVVLNQNINAEGLEYCCAPYTSLQLGSQYVLLRSEFMAWFKWKRSIPYKARRVLVTLGGSDPDNQTLKVIQAIDRFDLRGLEVMVVIGSCNRHSASLGAECLSSRATIRQVCNVRNMPELMAWADIAVSAGGSTCWELAFMGLPAVVLVLAENQKDIAGGLAQAGVVRDLGWYDGVSTDQLASALYELLEDHDMRVKMNERGRELVDGLGRKRILHCLLSQSDAGLTMVEDANCLLR